MKTIEQIVEKYYDKMLDELIGMNDDMLYDLLVEVQTIEGKTIRISWLERDKRLEAKGQ
jgi:hypothetical protein